MKAIEITIEPNGDVQIEGKGIHGPECLKLTADIEAAIGTVEKRVKTPEYHKPVAVTRKAGA